MSIPQIFNQFQNSRSNRLSSFTGIHPSFCFIFLLTLLFGCFRTSHDSHDQNGLGSAASIEFNFPSISLFDETPSLSVSKEYLIGFRHYDTAEHLESEFAKLVGPNSLNSPISSCFLRWRAIPRINPSQAYPTDFLLIAVEPSPTAAGCRSTAIDTRLGSFPSLSSFFTALREVREIKFVSEQKEIKRKLSSFNEEIEATQEDEFNAFFSSEFDSDSDSDTKSASEFDSRPGSFRRPLRFSSYSGFSSAGHSIRRSLKDFFGSGENIARLYGADKLWDSGHSGRGIRVAVFDTGLAADHNHFRRIKERTNWTDENTLDDGLGHGTFVAGVIASAGVECPGFAPDAELFIFRVFNQRQLSFTSWFLDAFNYAIHTKVHVLNLSIGGPDFLDGPFVEKVLEMSASGIIVVSAIGNDGPLYGTLNNPADQMDVIGVGGLDSDDSMASFSSRGMTTWELPSGYGRVKPDVVTLAKSIKGSKIHGGCRVLSGTSVASPVVAGAVALLASVIDEADRPHLLNPASLKQSLVESSRIVGNSHIFEQGMGKLNLLGAFEILRTQPPRVTAIPAELDFTHCPYMWPFCHQPLYANAQPIIFNLTLLNSLSVSSFLADSPQWIPSDEASSIVSMDFSYSEFLWPWSGFFAVHIRINSDITESERIVSGSIKFRVVSHTPKEFESLVTIPFKARVIPTPHRNRRILWDQFHNLRYPSGYFPRDNLDVKTDTLDWNGDHIHTNFKDLFNSLREHNYFIEVLGGDFTCFDASHYGAVLMVDSEEEFYDEEKEKIYEDLKSRGLNLIIIAEWFNEEIMKEIKFYDENTASWWTPETGGANIPALNEFLEPFGIEFSNFVVRGAFQHGLEHVNYGSGTTIAKFPAGGILAEFELADAGGSGAVTRNYPIVGGVKISNSTADGGRIVVYGDSNCLDMNHRTGPMCEKLLLAFIQYATTGEYAGPITENRRIEGNFVDQATLTRIPQRPAQSNFDRYSKVRGPNAIRSCAAAKLSKSTPATPFRPPRKRNSEVAPSQIEQKTQEPNYSPELSAAAPGSKTRIFPPELTDSQQITYVSDSMFPLMLVSAALLLTALVCFIFRRQLSASRPLLLVIRWFRIRAGKLSPTVHSVSGPKKGIRDQSNSKDRSSENEFESDEETAILA